MICVRIGSMIFGSVQFTRIEEALDAFSSAIILPQYKSARACQRSRWVQGADARAQGPTHVFAEPYAAAHVRPLVNVRVRREEVGLTRAGDVRRDVRGDVRGDVRPHKNPPVQKCRVILSRTHFTATAETLRTAPMATRRALRKPHQVSCLTCRFAGLTGGLVARTHTCSLLD